MKLFLLRAQSKVKLIVSRGIWYAMEVAAELKLVRIPPYSYIPLISTGTVKTSHEEQEWTVDNTS